jgi:phage FluMu protein Com
MIDFFYMLSSQTTNCQNRSILCVFCKESLSSSDAMRDHLNMCGNKTERCLKCGQFIRRAIFSYHLENNCLTLNENDESLEREDDSLASCSHDSSQTKLSDIITQEDKPLRNWFSEQPRGKPVTVECEYCHNQFSQKDYINHKVEYEK